MRKLRALPALALALSLTSACSGSISRGTPGGDTAPSSRDAAIVVENNLVPSTSVSVYAVTAQGSRQLLGAVPPSTTRRLRIPVGTVLERYRFVASVGINQNLTSNPLPVARGETVRWELNTNTVFIQ